MTQPPRSIEFDDVYFSADGGPEETIHVFCDGNNLPAAWQGRQRFAIGETGFGTGLNFLLAWELFDRTADKGAFLDFVSVEKFPMSVADIRGGLEPWADRLSPYLDKMLAQYPLRVPGFHRMVFDNRIALTLIFGDANEALPEIEGSIDAWFLDGFTPSKNPDMWTPEVFCEMARLSHTGSTFATFTAAGFVKRGLREAGFTVEKKKGFGRKRDMLAGFFEGGNAAPVVPDKKDVTILGAGLAGTACAYVLKQYGLTPVLYDPNGIASGASGNPVGIINPRFTAFKTAESDFYTAGYAMAARTFSMMDDVEYERCGSVHLMTDDEKEKRFSRTIENWGWHADHMQIFTDASGVAGVTLSQAALYLADSGRINPSKLCQHYAQGVDIKTKVPENYEGPVVFAHGASIAENDELSWIPLHTVRGQISFVKATEQSKAIKTNICYGGYLSAPRDGWHVVGSTFQKWLDHTDVLEEDHRDILAKLKENVPALEEALEVTGGRAALRTSSTDRFPVAGEIPGQESWFISTAHGSHGIVSTLISAHLIADILRGGVRCLGKSTINALSTQRFVDRASRKKASS